MTDHKLADIAFTLKWKSTAATHTDTYFVAKVNLSQDQLPVDLANTLIDLKVGENYSQTYPAKEVLGSDYSSDKVIHFKPDLFDQNFKGQYSPPILYRFYPSAIASEGLKTEVNDYTPFRIISKNEDNIVADKNHPLAKYYLTLTAVKIKEHDYPADADKRVKNIGKLISSRGPGMQAPFEYGDSVFFYNYPFENSNNQAPSKAQVDTNAAKQIVDLYSEQLPKFSKVLDLISDDQSFLDQTYKTGLLAGIGANETALTANNRLDTFQVQNLNKNTVLPFEDNNFDDAICTLAIETLIDPKAIMIEIARVVNSGGQFIVTFTDNGSSTDPISLWGQLHPFEKIQLVLEYFRQSGLFTELNTYSSKGALRSAEDKEISGKSLSDPIFAVWGKVK